MMTGFILAGGRSSRMGSEKALLRIGKRTLIEIIVQRLRPCVERLVVIGHSRNVQFFHALPVDAVLTDLKTGDGPLMGIYTGLLHTDTPMNLFVPCDMPWIDARLIESLASGCHGDVEAVASLHPLEGVQPFPLICHVNAGRTIGALLDEGARSLQALLRRPQTRLVTIDEPDLWPAFTNLNTLSEYATLTKTTLAS